MRSLNRVMLIGHLAADPELRQTKAGVSMVTFPLATNATLRDKNGGRKEVVDFHRVISWGRLAEICAEYLVKGTAVYLEGKIVNRSFDDKNGERHYRTEIVADELNILTWKRGGENSHTEVGLEKVGQEEIEVAEEEMAEVA